MDLKCYLEEDLGDSMKKKKVYAVYKGDNFLQLGTVKELAEYFNVSEKTIRHWATPSYEKRRGGKRKTGKNRTHKIAILIEDEEEEQ